MGNAYGFCLFGPSYRVFQCFFGFLRSACDCVAISFPAFNLNFRCAFVKFLHDVNNVVQECASFVESKERCICVFYVATVLRMLLSERQSERYKEVFWYSWYLWLHYAYEVREVLWLRN